jgi:hypothetical protein
MGASLMNNPPLDQSTAAPATASTALDPSRMSARDYGT